MSKEVGLLGLKCPKKGNEPIEWEYCLNKCTDRCNPLPLIHAFMRDRVKVPGVFSVTEILSPPQIGRLKRENGYFSTPDSLIWATFGDGWHNVMSSQEDKMSPDHVMEDRFTVPMKRGLKLTGQYDYYDGETKTLWDFKTTKVYPVSKMMAGNWDDNHFIEQINMYRRSGRPDAVRQKLKVLVKDWSAWEKHKTGMTPTMEFNIPILADAYIDGFTEIRLGLHTAEVVDPCPIDDLWVGHEKARIPADRGVPKRCRDYCEVCDVCPQWQAWLERHK